MNPALIHDPALILKAIRYARRQVGTPYEWGGSSPGGFDCSGIVYAAYRAAGYTGIGRTTYEQIKQGHGVDPRHLLPGDVVFPSAHHEGLYIGNGLVLSAPHTGEQVHILKLSEFAPGGLVAARRLIKGGGGLIAPRAIAGQLDNGLPRPHPNPAMRLPNMAAITSSLAATNALRMSGLGTPAQHLAAVFPGTRTQPGPKPVTDTGPQGLVSDQTTSSLADLARIRSELAPKPVVSPAEPTWLR